MVCMVTRKKITLVTSLLPTNSSCYTQRILRNGVAVLIQSLTLMLVEAKKYGLEVYLSTSLQVPAGFETFAARQCSVAVFLVRFRNIKIMRNRPLGSI
jgi:hypothetical protein